MLYWLLYPLHTDYPVLNVFRYITFRAAYAALTAMLISFILGPWTIRTLRRLQVGQAIREEGPQSHQSKAGTPTMGGVLIIDAVLVPTLLWADVTNPYIWIIVFATLAFGVIGFADDYIKVVKKRSLGLTARAKFGSQLAAGSIVAAGLYWLPATHQYSTVLTFPFLKAFSIDLGLFYFPFVVLVVVGASNAVNLTDGLDGLAIGSTLIAAGTYAILTYIAGHAVVATYLRVPNIPGSGELAVFCGALVGASLGFLWFNCYPAMIFMGDVGALAIGAAIGTLAVVTKMEILLVAVGGLFVVEALSVILQVASFKLTGKRVFRMAPLHHHFELSGWKEPQVIIRFWIVAIIFSLFALSTLKLR